MVAYALVAALLKSYRLASSLVADAKKRFQVSQAVAITSLAVK
jgi:hypothetical protein